MTSEKSFNYSPILFVLLIIASFFLGSLWTKTQYLEKIAKETPKPEAVANAQAQPAGEQPPTKEDIKAWAKEIGLDSNKFNGCFDNEKYKTNVTKDTEDGRLTGVTGTPAFFINGRLISGALPFSMFKDIIDFELNGGDWNNPNETVKAYVDGDEKNVEIGKTKTTVSKGNLPAVGKQGAPVEIIEFSDLECPFCKRFYDETFPSIKKEYIDSGKAVFYFKHFPLEFHPMATPYALAAECANEQGKFWEMHDKILQQQQ